LKWIALLLQELIIKRLLASLIGLLLDLTSAEHRLRALQACSLLLRTETSQCLRSARTHAIALLRQLSLLLSCCKALPELLLAEACKALRLLTIQAR
jgi:hypothetical protein